MYANLRVEVGDEVLYATHTHLDRDGVLTLYLDVENEDKGYDEYEHGPQEVREIVATDEKPVKITASY